MLINQVRAYTFININDCQNNSPLRGLPIIIIFFAVSLKLVNESSHNHTSKKKVLSSEASDHVHTRNTKCQTRTRKRDIYLTYIQYTFHFCFALTVNGCIGCCCRRCCSSVAEFKLTCILFSNQTISSFIFLFLTLKT